MTAGPVVAVLSAMPDEFDFRILADIDAALNATAFVLTVAGLVAQKRGAIALHKKLMLSAVGVSALFLCCYLVYHANAEPVPYGRDDWTKYVYYPLLISHVVLAAVLVPLLLRTVWLGLRDRRDVHRRWARWTAPIWLYVSLTGVVVYWFLYG